ncbi:hypothetical protein [Streptomyces inusitatus]|uniref:hypothetical protein n=1 Tax=Streptomyces inusitatus TaxID=68221 RepID=UPI001E404166|nr:hypothetical protein [Streptomyces inusitatus]
MSTFKLNTVHTPDVTGDTSTDIWERYQTGIQRAEAGGAVTKVSALSVAESAQHIGRPLLCHATRLNTRYIPDGFCWDEGDDRSSNYNNTGTDPGGWVPQGLTASHDSDNADGTINGRHVYLASWYRGKNGSQNEFARVSFVKNTGSSTAYGHVLLVEPTLDGSFTAVTRTHTDGMVWYGNRLFVANGGELQVYDMRHIWRMGSSSERVGVANGVSSARWHAWAMPMIGRYWTGDRQNPRGCQAATGSWVCLGSLSLDRTGKDVLVSGEYRSPAAGAGGRVIRWPLNSSTALPESGSGAGIATSTAEEGYTTPVWAMQGVATDGTYYYMSGQCPPGWNGDVPPDHEDAFSCIHRARKEEAPHVFTMAPRMTQNLSYSRFSGRLWGLNEKINTAEGDRVVFSIDVAP